MAAITDLTWQQWLDQLPANSIVLSSGKIMIDVGVVAGATTDALTDVGVIKFLANGLNGAFKAQVEANVGQATGERLAAFTAPATGSVANGYALVTRTFTSRSELASAINVIGQVN